MLRALPVLLLCGCYASHRPAAPSDDAGPRAVEAGPSSTCAAAERFVTVELEGETDRCTYGAFSFIDPFATARSDQLRVELLAIDESGRPSPCSLAVSGLSAPVAAAFALRFERIFDGFIDVNPAGLQVRDTSLCDGPPPSECPLMLEAQSGGLRPTERVGEIGVRWGETRCEGTCGRLRALEFSVSFGERVDRATLHQGEINTESRAGTRFANLRSWNSCTDEPDTITWAFWLH